MQQKRVFTRMFPAEQFSFHQIRTTLNLPTQPATDEETLACAEKRARNARELAPESDYWVGIEGGIADWSNGMGAFAWVVILDREGISDAAERGNSSFRKASPRSCGRAVNLAKPTTRFFSRNNSKHGSGAIGLLTGDVIDREGLYIPAVIFALVPFRNPGLYP